MKLRYILAGIAVLAMLCGIYALSGDAVAATGTVMAATVLSTQLSNDPSSTTGRKYPIDDHGKLRIAYGKYVNNTGGTLADGTEIEFFDLPPGRVRILPQLSRYRVTAQGAARVFDLGLRGYYPSNNPGTIEADDDDALVANKDVSAAVNDVALDGGATKMKWDIFSRNGVRVYGTVDGGTIPAAAEFEVYLVYVYE